MTSTTPANRSARLQLRARIDLATHAAELLHNKEEALQREHTRLRGYADRTENDWRQRLSDATSWLLRARSLGAGSDLALLHTPTQPATISIDWQTSMGVIYPGAVTTTPGPTPELTTTAALAPATTAFRAALAAAAQHAAAHAALQRVEAELADSRRRRRALEQHLVPRLDARLHQLDLALDEGDRESALRSQLAIKNRETTR